MGYSVYIRLTEQERPKVAAFLSIYYDAIKEAMGDAGTYIRGPRIGDLAYAADEDKANDNYVGCSYNGSYDIANTVVFALGTALGKSEYVYDGCEVCPLKRPYCYTSIAPPPGQTEDDMIALSLTIRSAWAEFEDTSKSLREKVEIEDPLSVWGPGCGKPRKRLAWILGALTLAFWAWVIYGCVN